MPSIIRNRRREKAKRMARLLSILKRDASSYVPVGDLIAAMGIGAATYPLLAELDRMGRVERQWLDGRELAYRLASEVEGLDETQDTLATKTS